LINIDRIRATDYDEILKGDDFDIALILKMATIELSLLVIGGVIESLTLAVVPISLIYHKQRSLLTT